MEAAPTCQLYSQGNRFQNQGQISKGLVESTRHITGHFPSQSLGWCKTAKTNHNYHQEQHTQN